MENLLKIAKLITNFTKIIKKNHFLQFSVNTFIINKTRFCNFQEKNSFYSVNMLKRVSLISNVYQIRLKSLNYF